jgi:hypothetical protein
MAMARLTNSTVMLRCAKHDRAANQMNAWINVLTYNSQADR